MSLRASVAAVLAVAVLAAAPHGSEQRRAVASFSLPIAPFLPGSIVPLALEGVSPPYGVDVLGPGQVRGSSYVVPQPADGSATLVAASASAVAMRSLDFAAPPNPATPFIAVASYDAGVVLHAPGPSYAQRSVLGIGGAPGDVSIDPAGTIGAAATNGVTATLASVKPWGVRSYDSVPYADEVAFDSETHAFFATDRDAQGSGAITRVAADGSVRTRLLGLTAEGLAVDSSRRRVYVANVNDGSISIVDADSLVEIVRFPAIARVFSLALNQSGTRLYAVSNQSFTSPFGAAGSVVVFDVSGKTPRLAGTSEPLAFPVGIAVDDRDHRVFVTDERDDDVYVLDARTLRARHAPLQTCRTPWKPLVDDGTLYVPCARADAVDAFDARNFARRRGAPFATGGYPLAVAVWHPRPDVKR